MKRQDFTFDETKLNLTFDKQGNAVWSFKAVKEGVSCEKIPIRFLSNGQRKFNREMFGCDRKLNSSIIPLISNSLMARRVKNALINVLERPRFVKRYHIQNHNIVRDFARKGLMDNHFNRKIVELAENFGFKPRGFNLHHKMPICLGGRNYSDNITLIQGRLHERLHQLTTNALAAFFEENKPNKIAKAHYVLMPVLPPVLTKKNIADYFNGFDDLLMLSQEKTAPQQLPNEKKHVQETIQTSEQNTLETPSVKAQLKEQLQSLSTVDQNKMTGNENKSGKRRHKKLNETWYSAVFKQRGRNAS